MHDSGPGVPQDAREAVFEKFSQLSDYMTDKPEGTGLGLATSRLIINRLGGMIWCDASPLGGAQFQFVLPRVRGARIAETSPAEGRETPW